MSWFHNPELRRNLWLELTPHRLLLTPVVLVLGGILIYHDSLDWEDVQWWAGFAFLVTVMVGGGRMAESSVLEEFRGHTWDGQRMSAISPWSMTWGKLLGGTLFVWYVGLLCLVVMVGASLRLGVDPARLTKLLVGMTSAGVIVQSLMMGITLLFIWSGGGKEGEKGGRRGSRALLILFLLPFLGGLVVGVADWLADGRESRFQWYGHSIPLSDFILWSLLVWCGWALLGVYRLMRREMLYRNGPWVWLLFLACLMGYWLGMILDEGCTPARVSDLWWCGLPFSLPLLLVGYALLLGEQVSPVLVRRLLVAWRRRHWRELGEFAPLWLLTLPILVLWLVGLTMWLPRHLVILVITDVSIRGVMAAMVLFVLRDVLLVLLVRLSGVQRRRELLSTVYLVLLYWFGPLLAESVPLESLLPWLLPHAQWGWGAVAPPLLEAALLGWLLVRRLRAMGVLQGEGGAELAPVPPRG